MRPFSFDVITSGANKLDKALSKEIKYENENYQQLEDIETFLQESGFAFNEVEEGVAMGLTKTIGEKTIEIMFDARQPLPEQEEEGGEEQGQDEEEQGLSENYCDFTIFISLMVSADVNAEKKVHRFERQMKSYAGPDFSTLDERIQTAITKYLEGFGVNEHLAA